MTTKKKVFLIVILGVGASLLTFLLGHYFSQKYRNTQHLLAVIHQMTNRIENIHLLSMDFIHNGDPKAWQQLTGNLDAIQRSMEKSPPFTGPGKQILHSLEEQLSHYKQLLDRTHNPAIQLNLAQGRMQEMRLAFSTEVSVSDFIITENHGGEMTVESKLGEGTTFIIKLPVQRQTNN